MAERLTIDASGRLVIPKSVRSRHRLAAGTELTLIEEDDRLVLVPRQGETMTAERGGLLVFRGQLTGKVPDHRELRAERLVRLADER
jgi:AbrB family looped-hinge helix DNA binding protein